MRVHLVILAAFLAIQISAQETFVQIHDFFNGADETARNMFVRGDTVYIVGTGDCDAGGCLHFYKLTTTGDIISTRRYSDIVPATRAWLRDSSIYVGGAIANDTFVFRDQFGLYELDLEGNIRRSVHYNQENLSDPPEYPINRYWQRGVIANEDKIVIYGDTYEDDGGSQEDNGGDDLNRGVLIYLNNDLSFDTLVYIDPVYRNMEMWNADLTTDGHLSFLYDYDEWDGVSTDFRDRIHYRTFAEYDNNGQELYRWNPPELNFYLFLFLSHKILSNGDVILHLTPTNQQDAHDLIRVNQNGEILWRVNQSFSNVQVGLLDISETKDGNILLAGFTDPGPDNASFLRKVDVSDGSVIWDRAYVDWEDPTRKNRDALTTFFKAHELPDGSILVAGRRLHSEFTVDSTIVSNNDFHLVRVDEEGCLEPGCGGYIQHIAGEPPFLPLIRSNNYWQFQDGNSPTGLAKKRYSVFLGEGGGFFEAKTVLHVDINDGIWEERQDRVFRIDEEARKIYYIEAWETDPDDVVLLYDFSLEVGDFFESDYIEHPLEVIESDTMRLSDKSKVRYWVLACTENPENTITWIENIGTYHGVVWPPDFCSGDYGPETLTCYYWKRRFTHMNPDVEDCLMPNSTDDQSYFALAAITAHPNPTQDHVLLTAPQDLHIERVELLDTRGITHTSFYEDSSEVRLDLSGYPSGLYFVSVHTRVGSVVKRVVVE